MSPPPSRAVRRVPVQIGRRLFAASFGLLAAAVVLTTMVAFYMATDVIDRERRDTMMSLLSHADQLMEAYQNQFGVLLLSLAGNGDLWTLPQVSVERILKAYLDAYPLAERLYIIRDGRTIIGTPRAQIRTLGPLALGQIMAWFDGSARGVICSEPYLSKLSNWTITVGLRVDAGPQRNPGIIAMDISLIQLPVFLSRLDFRDPSTMVVFTNRGNTVIAQVGNPVFRYSVNENRLRVPDALLAVLESADAVPRRVRQDGQSYTVLSLSPANRYGWKPVFISSDAVVRRTLRTMIVSGAQMLLLVLVASFFIDWLLTRQFSRPLEKLAAEVKRVRVDAYDGISYTERKDEVGVLALAIDGMIRKITSLIEDLRESDRKKREADLRAIDAQVNPHFLFNTLNSIGHCVDMGRNEDVHSMIQALIRVLSISLDKVSERVMLAKELEFIQYYLKLLKLTRPDEFSVLYAIAPGVGAVPVPKLILQPLVENAVLHGFNGLGRPGTLKISAFSEDGGGEPYLVVRVEDNGHGIGEDAIETLRRRGNGVRGGGIGMRSVAERIELHYADRGAFRVDRLAPGTVVTLRIPCANGIP